MRFPAGSASGSRHSGCAATDVHRSPKSGHLELRPRAEPERDCAQGTATLKLKGRAGLICQGVASRLVGQGLGGRSLVVDQAFEASLEILLNLMPLNDGATHSFCIQHDASHNLEYSFV